MNLNQLMHLADIYAHESMKGNEYDNRLAIAEARKVLLEALKKVLNA